MAGISFIFCSQGQEIIITYGSVSEHINSSNHKIISFDKMSKIIVKLGSEKCETNKNNTCQLICLYNSLILSIDNTPEKDVSIID